MIQFEPYQATSGRSSVHRAVLASRVSEDRSWRPTQIARADRITEEELDRCLRMHSAVERLLAA